MTKFIDTFCKLDGEDAIVSFAKQDGFAESLNTDIQQLDKDFLHPEELLHAILVVYTHEPTLVQEMNFCGVQFAHHYSKIRSTLYQKNFLKSTVELFLLGMSPDNLIPEEEQVDCKLMNDVMKQLEMLPPLKTSGLSFFQHNTASLGEQLCQKYVDTKLLLEGSIPSDVTLCVCVIGASGVGKSTMINTILDLPQEEALRTGIGGDHQTEFVNLQSLSRERTFEIQSHATKSKVRLVLVDSAGVSSDEKVERAVSLLDQRIAEGYAEDVPKINAFVWCVRQARVDDPEIRILRCVDKHANVVACVPNSVSICAQAKSLNVAKDKGLLPLYGHVTSLLIKPAKLKNGEVIPAHGCEEFLSVLADSLVNEKESFSEEITEEIAKDKIKRRRWALSNISVHAMTAAGTAAYPFIDTLLLLPILAGLTSFMMLLYTKAGLSLPKLLSVSELCIAASGKASLVTTVRILGLLVAKNTAFLVAPVAMVLTATSNLYIVASYGIALLNTLENFMDSNIYEVTKEKIIEAFATEYVKVADSSLANLKEQLSISEEAMEEVHKLESKQKSMKGTKVETIKDGGLTSIDYTLNEELEL